MTDEDLPKWYQTSQTLGAQWRGLRLTIGTGGPDGYGHPWWWTVHDPAGKLRRDERGWESTREAAEAAARDAVEKLSRRRGRR